MKKKIGKICLLIYGFMFGCINYVHALDWGQLYSGLDVTDSSSSKVVSAAAYIAGWLRYGAIAVAVGMLMVKGIQFILAAPEGKAEVKKQMIPWAIGLVILFTFNIVFNIISDIGYRFNLTYGKPDNVI